MNKEILKICLDHTSHSPKEITELLITLHKVSNGREDTK